MRTKAPARLEDPLDGLTRGGTFLLLQFDSTVQPGAYSLTTLVCDGQQNRF